MTIKITNWSVAGENSPYLAPELIQIRLNGEVYNHPKFKDGSEITTSIIKKADGLKITTQSGSKYLLDKIDPKYKKWIDKNYNKPWDEKNPIIIHKSTSKYMMATKAIHKIGDISRPEPDICHIYIKKQKIIILGIG